MSNGSYRPVGFGFISPVIKSLLIANVAVFFIEMMMDGIRTGGIPLGGYFTRYFALFPVGEGFLPWQLFTYQFMHANFSHIFFNLFALWMFGTEVEYNLGSKKFLIFYLAAGVGAGLLHLATPLLGVPSAPTVGASGSLYGVMIAFALFNPDRYIYIYFLLPVKAKYLIGFMILLDLFMFGNANSNVAHLAHIGGAITGFLFLFFDPAVYFPFKTRLKGGGRSSNQFGSGGFPYSRDDDDDNYSSNYRASEKPKQKFGFGFGSKKGSDSVVDAKFKDVTDDSITQEEIDRILDKISVSGYSNLTEKEKKILFEASSRMSKKGD
jgi:membrane associated rhomboid family serine protease